ncbi:MAG: hypothetical protein Q7R32_08590 [Dehalococcoidia bacterium]|nr:hypothetical protein [Dehalococcoidia bacterium]
MRLGKVEDVTDQVGDLFPPALHDTAGTVRSMSEVFALADSVILIDSTAIISEVKDMVPRLMMKDWAFGTPLEGHQRVSALVPADYHRLYNKLFLNRISALNALLPAADIWRDFIRAHETVTPQSPALSSQVTGISHDLVGHVLGVTQLSAGWDGYHAKPIAGHTAEIAISLLNYVHARATAEGLLLQSPLVSPTPDGSIQLEWDHPDVFLTVEIPLREPISFYLERKDGEELGRDSASQEEVWEAVRAVCKS